MFLSRVCVVIVAVILYTGQVAAFSPALRSLALRGAQLPASVGTIDASNTVMGVVSMDTTGESRKTPDFFAALSYLGATATEFTLIGVFLHIAQIGGVKLAARLPETLMGPRLQGVVRTTLLSCLFFFLSVRSRVGDHMMMMIPLTLTLTALPPHQHHIRFFRPSITLAPRHRRKTQTSHGRCHRGCPPLWLSRSSGPRSPFFGPSAPCSSSTPQGPCCASLSSRWRCICPSVTRGTQSTTKNVGWARALSGCSSSSPPCSTSSGRTTRCLPLPHASLLRQPCG